MSPPAHAHLKAIRQSRRVFLARATLGATAATSALAAVSGCRAPHLGASHGRVIGQPGAEEIGEAVLRDGGNAIDAIVAAALAGAVLQPHQTGIGGYGAIGTFAVEGGRRVFCLDANSTAPAAATANMFQPDNTGAVPGRVNEEGWLASGVPGVMAGLALAVERFGTRPFSAALQPAIGLVRDGFALSPGAASALRSAAPALAKDPGSRRLYLPNDRPPAAGEVFRNSELAALLHTLAQANSVESFYRGPIAERIAEAFGRNGGVVTTEDLAEYRARWVEPLRFRWGQDVFFTGPLTGGGLTILQILAVLKALDWKQRFGEVERAHAQVEAMRLAWRDRLTLLGDPEHVADPTTRLLSNAYARESAEHVRRALNSGTLIPHTTAIREQSGTLSFSAVDRHGNMAALTLTHGNSFGARVTVPALGLTLGHGMSRFDPHPGHPNAPGPGKRPLHNMTPTIVIRGGRAVAAVGGRGGRRIPNSTLEFLLQTFVLDRRFEAAMTASRLHTEGDRRIEYEAGRPDAEIQALRRVGYETRAAGAATLSAVMRTSQGLLAAMR